MPQASSVPAADLPADSQKTATQGFLALHAVTSACVGIRNSYLTAPTPAPAWFAGLDSSMQAARLHAGNWVDTMAPKITANIPSQILSFGAVFVASTKDILDILNEAAQGGGLTDAMKNDISGDIDDLKYDIKKIKNEMDDLSSQMSQFVTTLERDHAALFKGASSIQAAEADLQETITRCNDDIAALQADISSIRSQLLASELSLGPGIFLIAIGIAVVPVSGLAGGLTIGGGVITTAVAGGFAGHYAKQISDDQAAIWNDQNTIADDKKQLVALNSLSTVVSSAMDCINDAISNLAAVRSMWDQYDQMLATISNQLQQSGGDNITVDQLYLGQAQKHWNDMVTFAENLLSINANVTMQNVDFPYPQAA
jgi:hypothetical protein